MSLKRFAGVGVVLGQFLAAATSMLSGSLRPAQCRSRFQHGGQFVLFRFGPPLVTERVVLRSCLASLRLLQHFIGGMVLTALARITFRLRRPLHRPARYRPVALPAATSPADGAGCTSVCSGASAIIQFRHRAHADRFQHGFQFVQASVPFRPSIVRRPWLSSGFQWVVSLPAGRLSPVKALPAGAKTKKPAQGGLILTWRQKTTGFIAGPQNEKGPISERDWAMMEKS